MPNPVVHFDIGCRDRDKTNTFFTKLFGWSTTDYGPLSKSVNTGTEDGIQGYLTSLGHEPHNYVMVYVEVENIASTLENVTELGGEVVIPETEIPGGGHFAWFKDIDGNMLGLIKKNE
ncbi:MAG: VOC family protein [Planctomycetota bacterium]